MTDRTRSTIAVLGAGSWGTTLAIHLARNGHAVRLWGHDAAHIAWLMHERCNTRYLPQIKFPDALALDDDLARAIDGATFVLLVVPSGAFRRTLELIAPRLHADTQIAWGTKGLEPGSAKRLSEVATEVLGARAFAAISGPTFAREIAQSLPAAIAVAARDRDYAEAIAQQLRGERLRVYANSDVIGVEIGGAVKNVMAIAAGISDGLGFGANARAALLTRGLAEITRLGIALGAQADTFTGLTGMGDLILTCTDDQSRNRQVGLGLGRGETLGAITARLGQVAEGVATAREVHRLAHARGVEMPITAQVYRVLYEDLAPQTAVTELLRRGAKAEGAAA